jgi:alpha-beta hydrolase superfamily lysophospholipase
MSKQEIVLSSRDGYKLSLAIFPSKEPKANVQVIHGMQEHKERYYAFAEYLSERGYNVIVSDLRGHGNNAPKLSHIADKQGDKLILEDQREITKYIKERFSDLPIIILAHSMGTMITRVLLQEDSKNYSKVVLSGYVNPNPAGGVAVALGNLVGVFKKPTKKSKLLTSLAVGPFAKSVKNRKTDLDWLSYNEENVQNYIADPLCGVEFTVGSYKALFHFMNDMGKAKKYHNVNESLPILLIAGKDDPCTGGEKGRETSKKVLCNAGFKDISVITLDNMRHEILQETEKEKVMEQIYNFLEK